MLAPEIQMDEQKRVKKLHALNILDTAAEERFDRLTRLAKRAFNVDISITGSGLNRLHSLIHSPRKLLGISPFVLTRFWVAKQW